MGKFNFEDINLHPADNETIAALDDLLWPETTSLGEEENEIYERYKEDIESLIDSMNPKQKKLFDRYQQMVDDAQALAEQKRFICGFKTAMRLALEGMK